MATGRMCPLDFGKLKDMLKGLLMSLTNLECSLGINLG